MPSFQPLNQQTVINFTTFARLDALLQQMAQTWGEKALIFTEAILASAKERTEKRQHSRFLFHTEWFTLLASEQFSALLVGETVRAENTAILQTPPADRLVRMSLSFDPEAIAQFLTQLSDRARPETLKLLEQAKSLPQPNDATLQNEFTLALIGLLSPWADPLPDSELFSPEPSFPSDRLAPTETILRQRLQQERLINQVVTQIRQSLQLPVILSTAVEQVRHFLQADRLLIYQFNERSAASAAPPEVNLSRQAGCVTYEARAAEAIAPILHFRETDTCFTQMPEIWEKYRQGCIRGVEDVEITYATSPCFLKFLRSLQVRAKLVVPIVVQEQLWGLLIAQQCHSPRYWHDREKSLLKQIAEHLAIAIYQAELYAQLQQQKQFLEQRVSERTAELRDALLGAQAANRAKSEFLAAMSHELRTPLTCVIGMSATLLRLPFGQTKARSSLSVEKQRDYLQTIHDSGKHLLDLINGILDLSQVESGKALLDVSSFSLTKLAYECQELLQPKADVSGVDLKIEVEVNRKSDRFRADRRRVEQILLNLLSNAVKFTPAGGEVMLRVWIEDRSAVFQVEDTGIGIPEEARSLLFQKFQQLDTSYHRNYEGMGLGLALTKQLVDLHNGTIEVESTVDVGSIFTVRLPAQPAALVENPPVPKSKLMGVSLGRLVLIENHEETAWFICDLLTAAGYQVVWLVEGTAAVKQIEILQPVVAIAAIQLLSMDGYEIVRQLRASKTTKSIKILLLTEKNDRESAFPASDLAADDSLPKPVQPEQLLQKIASLIAAARDGTPHRLEGER